MYDKSADVTSWSRMTATGALTQPIQQQREDEDDDHTDRVLPPSGFIDSGLQFV
jgi:hypothetical protein